MVVMDGWVLVRLVLIYLFCCEDEGWCVVIYFNYQDLFVLFVEC